MSMTNEYEDGTAVQQLWKGLVYFFVVLQACLIIGLLAVTKGCGT